MASHRATRVLRAAFWSPLVTTVVFWAEMVLIVVISDVTEARKTAAPLGAAGLSLFFVLFFGAPMVYFGALVLGTPLWWFLRSIDRLTPRWVIAMAAAAGALACPVGLRIVFGSWDWGGAAVAGAVAATVGGSVFVWLARFEPIDESVLSCATPAELPR